MAREESGARKVSEKAVPNFWVGDNKILNYCE